MTGINERLRRLERRVSIAPEDVHNLAGRMAPSLGVSTSELLAEAQAIASREAEIGRPALLIELADAAGISPGMLRADIAAMEMEFA